MRKPQPDNKSAFTSRNVAFVTLLFISIFFIIPSSVDASYIGSVHLSSQSDVDNYPSNYGSDSIGLLQINANGLILLDSLYQLRYVGTLAIGRSNNNTLINTFKGLDSLHYLNGLSIGGILPQQFNNFPPIEINRLDLINAEVINLNGLTKVKSLSQLRVSGCPNFESFQGLSSIDSIDYLYLSYAPQVQNIKLPGLNYINSIQIDNCPKFEQIDSLGSVTSISHFHITYCGSLSNGTLEIRHPIKSVYEVFKVEFSSYDSISYEALDSVVDFRISSCPELKNVRIAKFVNDVTKGITISSCPLLHELSFTDSVNLGTIGRFALGDVGNFDLSFIKDMEIAREISIGNSALVEWPFKKLIHLSYLTLSNNLDLVDCCDLYYQIVEHRILELSIQGNGLSCETLSSMYQNCGTPVDTDGDRVMNVDDNCPLDYNESQLDTDADGVGNVCDNCPLDSNTNQMDSNGNGIGDECEDPNYSIILEAINGDVFVDEPLGLVLRGVNNSCFRILIDDTGELRTIKVKCP